MTVFVVVCDAGLNGAWVEAVCSTQAAAEAIAAEVNRRAGPRGDHPGGVTGFGGAEVVEFVVDGPES